MQILRTTLSTLRTGATIGAAYIVYSTLAALHITVPTLQELLSNKTLALTKTPKQQSETMKVCELIALGYQVTAANGALELCITKHVAVAK